MFFLQLTALAALATLGAAHSWVEEYQVISENGSYTGALGYTRGFVPRTDPTFNGFSMLWLQPNASARNEDGTTRTRIDSSDYVCAPQQRTATYSSGYPKLQVSPGDYVAMKYLENGHVTLPWNITGKPQGGGPVFIFGTTNPSPEEKLVDVMEWNKQGTGGNKNGFLLAAQNYDDGRCHQINCGSISQQRQMLQPLHAAGQQTSTLEAWCESDVQIPENTATGTLTVYWVWQFPTAPNVDCNQPAGKDEYYTSCADFDVIKRGEAKKVIASSSTAASGNPQSVAVKNYKSRTAYTATPSAVVMQNNKIVGSLPTVNQDFVSSCTAEASVVSQNNLNLWPEVYVPNSCSAITAFGTAAASSAAAKFSQAASSYSAGSKSAWSAAFANAKVAMPTRVPWSSAYNAAQPAQPKATSAASQAPAQTGATPSVYTSAAPSAAADDVVTLTTVMVITSTMEPGQSAPTSAPAGTSSPAASTTPSAAAPSSSVASQAPSSSAATSSSATYPSSASASLPVPTFSAGEDSASIPTISTVGGAPASSPTAAASAAIPSAPTNGTAGVYRRWHARNFR